MVALAMEGLAGAVGSTGQHPASARLLGVADAIRRSASVPAAPSEHAEFDRIAAMPRRALGEPAFNAAYEHGANADPRRRVKVLTPTRRAESAQSDLPHQAYMPHSD
jgi:hypothetical protein